MIPLNEKTKFCHTCSFFFCHASSSLLKFQLFFQHFVCSFIQINQFYWIKTTAVFFYVYFVLYKFIYLLVKKSIVKIWKTEKLGCTCILWQIFAKFLDLFSLLRVFVLELSARLKDSVMLHLLNAYLKLKWVSTPFFVCVVTVKNNKKKSRYCNF